MTETEKHLRAHLARVMRYTQTCAVGCYFCWEEFNADGQSVFGDDLTSKVTTPEHRAECWYYKANAALRGKYGTEQFCTCSQYLYPHFRWDGCDEEEHDT